MYKPYQQDNHFIDLTTISCSLNYVRLLQGNWHVNRQNIWPKAAEH